MDRFLYLTFDGLSRGAVYSAFALALVLIWRAARIVNFAQGAMAVATAYAGYSVADATGSYWLGFVVAITGGLVLGAVVERVVMRFVDRSSPLNGVVVALGLVLIIQGVLGMIYGNEYRPAPAPFSRDAFEIGGVALLSRYDLFVFAAVGAVVVLLTLLFTRTSTGLRMRAAAFAPDVSRLLGVPVGGMLTLGWALAAAVGSLAASRSISPPNCSIRTGRCSCRPPARFASPERPPPRRRVANSRWSGWYAPTTARPRASRLRIAPNSGCRPNCRRPCSAASSTAGSPRLTWSRASRAKSSGLSSHFASCIPSGNVGNP